MKVAIIGNRYYVPVRGGVRIYEFGDDWQAPWLYIRFIANSWYDNVNTDEL